MTPHVDSHSTTDPKPESLSAVWTGDRISRDWEMYAALLMYTCAEKTTFLGKDDLSIVEWGGEGSTLIGTLSQIFSIFYFDGSPKLGPGTSF